MGPHLHEDLLSENTMNKRTYEQNGLFHLYFYTILLLREIRAKNQGRNLEVVTEAEAMDKNNIL